MISPATRVFVTDILNRSMYVKDWPEDEREMFRRPGWDSFDERTAAILALRVEKIVSAVYDDFLRDHADTSEDGTHDD